MSIFYIIIDFIGVLLTVYLMRNVINDLNDNYFKKKYYYEDWINKLNYFRYSRALFVPSIYFENNKMTEGYKQLLFLTIVWVLFLIVIINLFVQLGIIDWNEV